MFKGEGHFFFFFFNFVIKLLHSAPFYFVSFHYIMYVCVRMSRFVLQKNSFWFRNRLVLHHTKTYIKYILTCYTLLHNNINHHLISSIFNIKKKESIFVWCCTEYTPSTHITLFEYIGPYSFYLNYFMWVCVCVWLILKIVWNSKNTRKIKRTKTSSNGAKGWNERTNERFMWNFSSKFCGIL